MYQVEFRPQAAQDFEKLDQAVADRVLKKLRWLAENFDSIKPEPLAGPFTGLLKLRVGDYRALYQADRVKKVLTVRLVGHRREIYDKSP
ncbi:MAG TPA: type II toxin-antitoxin system RelE/ParE family toxin [Terriglobia bacterium]|nr:type II toxin-antitoxin system RelE/ParE family toxin [Terriglobia bacterium]HEV2352140.1 type II toxin-antitoxin system RelE/ParE family toxin [Terriglobia bacterium]